MVDHTTTRRSLLGAAGGAAVGLLTGGASVVAATDRGDGDRFAEESRTASANFYVYVH